MLEELIYDWNQAGGFSLFPKRGVLFDDKTLRDGLQNPSVHDRTIEKKVEILHLREALGNDSVCAAPGQHVCRLTAAGNSGRLSRFTRQARCDIRG